MKRRAAVLAAVLCAAVCVWAESRVPIVAVIPFEAADALVTLIGVNPVTASVAARQAESMDALMAAVPGLCAELLESIADGGNEAE
ncbi:MAG: hypothetical protein HDR37_09840 [Treponema sp.]|nr:hypothetical protein [Treponema sp.]